MKFLSIDCRLVNSSGIGTYLQNTLSQLLDIAKEIKFTLIGNDFKKIKNTQGVSLVSSQAPIYSVKEQIDLFRKIPSRTDLFWSPHINIPIFYSGKLLITVHDLFHLAMTKFVKGLPKNFYTKLIFSAIKRKGSAFICVSKFTADQLQAYLKIDSSKIRVIYNGVDKKWFGISKNKSPRPNSYFLFVGNVKPHKNLKTLLEAFDLLINKIPHDLVIVGKKEGFLTADKEVIKKAKKFGNRVHFAGFLPDEELKQFYAHADALVFPSLYEGFGLPPLEAMASGCPTLVSRIPSLLEVCGNSAMYFDPLAPEDIADKMLSILKNPLLRRSLIDEGRLHAKKFSWEKSAQETLEVIKETI